MPSSGVGRMKARSIESLSVVSKSIVARSFGLRRHVVVATGVHRDSMAVAVLGGARRAGRAQHGDASASRRAANLALLRGIRFCLTALPVTWTDEMVTNGSSLGILYNGSNSLWRVAAHGLIDFLTNDGQKRFRRFSTRENSSLLT